MTSTEREKREIDLAYVREYAKNNFDAEVNQIGTDSWVIRPTGENNRQRSTVFTSYRHMRSWINSDARRRGL